MKDESKVISIEQQEVKENGENTKQKEQKRKRGTITNTKRIVGTAVFAALAFGVSFLEFPIFPATGFLKLDFSLVFIVLAGFIFGPIYGGIAGLVKELLRLPMSSTGGVGEIANFLLTLSFMLIPTIVYVYKKGLTIVIITLIAGCLIEVGASLLTNRFINYPLFLGDMGKEVFNQTWYFVALFNLIKSVSVSIITIVLYKHVSKLIKIM